MVGSLLRVGIVVVFALLSVAGPASAVSLTFDLDQLEGTYAVVPEAKTQAIVFSPTQLFRFSFVSFTIEGEGICGGSPCDPAPSFRLEFDTGVFVNLGPYPDTFSETIPFAFFRPFAVLPGESLPLGLALGRFPDANVFQAPIPSAPTTLTRVEVSFTGDLIGVPEPGTSTGLLCGFAVLALVSRRTAMPRSRHPR